MAIDANASGRWVNAESGLRQSRSLPHYKPKDAFFAEVVKIGRYDLIYRVGSGGMATVFVARLSGLAGFERLIAVKVIHQHLADSRKFVQMFLDEARMAASIHHPNVVETYEVGRDEGLFYIVGEFVPGQDLNRLLRRSEEKEKPLSQGMIAKIASQICFGLHAAHETRDKDGNLLNLIHRDVSPNNILISYDGYVKLIDFGVAWARNKMAQTESGALKGKIGYISPEQITGQELDRRSDIFSVGVLAYTMATLTHPFPGNSDAERLNKIVTGDMLPPHEIFPEIEPEFERIILKAMSSSPKDRYRTAAEMGKDLESFAESTGHEIKADSLAVLMQELFDEEQSTHQSRISAYRTAIERGSKHAGEYSDDDLFLADTETYAEQSDSGYHSETFFSRPGRKKRLLLLSVAAIGIIGIAALFIILLNRDPLTAQSIEKKNGRAHVSPAADISPTKSESETASSKSRIEDEKSADNADNAVIRLLGKESRGTETPSQMNSTPEGTKGNTKTAPSSGKRWYKKQKNKKQKPELLTSPYS